MRSCVTRYLWVEVSKEELTCNSCVTRYFKVEASKEELTHHAFVCHQVLPGGSQINRLNVKLSRKVCYFENLLSAAVSIKYFLER
jgi:hypothetical protein